jgi:hypothetical protein
MPQTEDLSDALARAQRNQRETDKKLARLVESIKAGVPADVVAGEIANLRELATSQDKQIQTLLTQQAIGQLRGPDRDVVRALWEEWRSNAAYLSEGEKANCQGCSSAR